MPLTDVPDPVVNQLEEDVREIRRTFGRIVKQNTRALGRIRALVGTHTRSVVATELGGDGPAMLALYNSLKATLESAEVGQTVEDLP